MARTGFHIVDTSPWPFTVAMSVLGLMSSLIGFFHFGFSRDVCYFLFMSVFVLGLSLVRWWGDMILESTYLGRHTKLVVHNLRAGMLLFIMSEVFFFMSFFWAFFNSMVGEISMNKVGHWPPLGIKAIVPWKMPALNTVILLSSGITVTWAHKAIRVHNKCPLYGPKNGNVDFKVKGHPSIYGQTFNNWLYKYEGCRFSSEKSREMSSRVYVNLLLRVKKSSPDFSEIIKLWADPGYFKEKENLGKKYRSQALYALALTIVLGLIFTSLQFNEYYLASFTIAEGLYGSTFYVMTGFHGLHVLVGTMFLVVCWCRVYLFHFTYNRHYFGLDAAIWYWHFVDGVWVALFGAVYIWGYL
uniref:Cytochrome c oxidase subunit 3 n=1 Tax=Spisula sachalinensis TaxID=81899 RepID=A0A2H4U906_SPISA|nr:cytochrome c oxidase subunit III [Pseudocardium sachalinense]